MGAITLLKVGKDAWYVNRELHRLTADPIAIAHTADIECPVSTPDVVARELAVII